MHFNSDFCGFFIGIVITGRKWCRNIKRLLHGYHVTFKFGDGICFRFSHFYVDVSVELQCFQCFIQIRQVALHIEVQYEIDCIKQFRSNIIDFNQWLCPYYVLIYFLMCIHFVLIYFLMCIHLCDEYNLFGPIIQ